MVSLGPLRSLRTLKQFWPRFASLSPQTSCQGCARSPEAAMDSRIRNRIMDAAFAKTATPHKLSLRTKELGSLGPDPRLLKS